MKKILPLLASPLIFLATLKGQVIKQLDAVSGNQQFTITERGPHHAVFSKVSALTNSQGEVRYRTNSYTALASGMHYLKNGEWVETKAEIELTSDGAAATNGPHKVIFAANANSKNAVDLTTPDGKRLRSRVFGLSYFDGNNAVLIAEVKDTIGILIGSNEIIYTNAFDDVAADIQYHYTHAGLEQNIVLREQPPAPQQFNLNPATTRLQVLTEFDGPAPQKLPIPGTRDGMLSDEFLDFGSMKIGAGRAFSVGDASQGNTATRVYKEWATLSGRTFLVEEVPFPEIQQRLQNLARNRQASIKKNRTGQGESMMAALQKGILKSTGEGKAVAKAMQMVKANQPQHEGFVIDYDFLQTDTNFTFHSDMTYYCTNLVNFSGTNTIEGGTVIKFRTNAAINFLGSVVFKTAYYRPVIFTAKDDDSIGQAVQDSTGNPVGYYGDGITISTGSQVRNARFSYLNRAIDATAAGTAVTIEHAQFVNCGRVLVLASNTFYLRNVLIANSGTNFFGNGGDVRGEHLTIHNSASLARDDVYGGTGSSLAFTNTILATVTNLGNYATFVTNSVAILYSDEEVFQTVGAGSHYLADGSPYRDAGTTNINAGLALSLTNKTTYPPVVVSNVTFSVDTNLWPLTQRDTFLPDLGYHYEPIDILSGFFAVTNSTMTLKPGFVLSYFNTSGAIWAREGSVINAVGEPLAPVWFSHYLWVQEQSLIVGNVGNSVPINTSHYGSPAANATLRFTKFSPPHGGYSLLDGMSDEFTFGNLAVRDCEFWGGTTDVEGGTGTVASIQNSLFHRNTFEAGSGYTNSLSFSNNLVRGGSLIMFGDAYTWEFHNNVFDGVPLVVFGHLSNSHNAYINCSETGQFIPTNSTDLVLTNFT